MGILAWLVQGCLRWQKEGLGTPPAVEAATRGYRDEMDPVRHFLAECCVESHDVWTEATKLFEAFSRWAAENSETVINRKSFGSRMTDLGFGRDRKGGGGRYRYLGLNLLNDFEPSSRKSPYEEEQGESYQESVQEGSDRSKQHPTEEIRDRDEFSEGERVTQEVLHG